MNGRGNRHFYCGQAFALALALMGTGPALAQDFNRVAPNQPASRQPGGIVVPAEKPIVPMAENPLILDSLKGLRFVDTVQKIVRTGVTGSGVTMEGGLKLAEDPAIKARLAAFLGKPVYANDLPRISQMVLDWYRARGLLVVDVVFPEQDISSGVIQAVVTAYRLGQIKVEGNKWFSSDLLRHAMKLKPGEPIDFGILKNDLTRLSRNPFRQVGAVLQRSDVVGDTDILLRAEDRLPLRLYAGFDNQGLPVTGRDQYSAGFNWGNVFGLDHQLSYRFITSSDLWRTRDRGPGHSNAPRMMSHSLTYAAPLPWGDTLDIFGAYTQQVPNLGPNFDQVGHSLQISARYEKALPSSGSLSHQIQFGFDYKRSDNNLAFGGTGIFSGATNIQQFLLVYSATRPDAYGQTAIENNLVFSLGGLSDGNRTAAFVASGVTGATATYAYDNLRITRVTFLPWEFSAVARLNVQIATAELLSSEQLGAGGSDSVRGYNPRAANGTQGLLTSLEIRSPTFSPLQRLGAGLQDAAQLLAFYDAGFVSNRFAQAGTPRSATLQSAGLGARYSVGRFVDMRLDYGWQLNRPPGAPKKGSLIEFSVTLAN